MNAEDKFIAALMEDVSKGQLESPTLPEIAVKIRKPIDDPMVSADRVAMRQLYQRVIDRIHQEIGQLILEKWHFPPELVQVAAQHEDHQRNPRAEPDYTDVVLIANLHSYMGRPKHKTGGVDRNEIPAFDKLGLTPG